MSILLWPKLFVDQAGFKLRFFLYLPSSGFKDVCPCQTLNLIVSDNGVGIPPTYASGQLLDSIDKLYL